MEINIDNVVSTVRTIDGETLLSKKILRQIVRAVLDAIDEKQEHAIRVRAEQGLEVSLEQNGGLDKWNK